MIPIKVHMKSGGEFRLWTRNPDGSIGDDTDWFPNLITNVGLVNMTTVTDWANRFHIGSSSATPLVTDTALNAWLAQSNTLAAGGSGVNLGNPDYQAQETRVRRFIPGASRTIREIGVNNNSSNVDMSIHALVTPEINQSDQQILDAAYRLTSTPSQASGNGIVNIFGDDYDYIVRMSEIDLFELPFQNYRPRSNVAGHAAYNGDIGSVTGSPTGDADFATSVAITSQGSGFCNYTITFGIDEGNLTAPDGIRSIRSQIFSTGGSSALYIQVEFRNRGEGTGVLDSRIPKDNTREVAFNLGLTWSRP